MSGGRVPEGTPRDVTGHGRTVSSPMTPASDVRRTIAPMTDWTDRVTVHLAIDVPAAWLLLNRELATEAAVERAGELMRRQLDAVEVREPSR